MHIILRIRGGMFHETSSRKDFDSVQYLCLRDQDSTESNIVTIQRIEELEEMIRLLKSNM